MTEGSSSLERLLHEQMEKRMALANNEFSLPTVVAPLLENLEVTVAVPPAPTAEEATRLLVAELRSSAVRTARTAGEPLAHGDEIQLDTVAWIHSTVVPFSIRHAQWLILEAMPLLPGLMEALVGQPVAVRRRIQVTLPASYPISKLRGETISVDVHVAAARVLAIPSPTDPAVLERLGIGAGPEELERALWSELETRASVQMRIAAENQVLDLLIARSRTALPRGLVDEEIRRRWEQTEGSWARALGLSLEAQQQALAGWLDDEATRTDAERRIQIGLVLRAIMIRDRVVLTEGDLRSLLTGAAEALGVTLGQVGDSLRGDPTSVEKIVQTAIHLRAVQHVMKHARVHEQPRG